MQPLPSAAPHAALRARRRILVPLGLAALGETKLPVARDCARAFGADVLLLHVLPTAAHGAEVQPGAAAARAYLDTVVAYLQAAGVHTEAIVRSGPVVATIVDEARQRAADLIILGASLRPAVLRALLGSVADAVVDAAPCPVLLVRPAREAGVGPPLQSFATATARAGALTRRLPKQQTVEVARIIGSVDRAHELAADFRPPRRTRRDSDERRLARIHGAMARGERLPAVELYQLGSGYYVLDGHHRVAAARLLGQLALDATVVEFVPRSGELTQPIGGGIVADRPDPGLAQAAPTPAARQPRAPASDPEPWPSISHPWHARPHPSRGGRTQQLPGHPPTRGTGAPSRRW